jgi:acyl-CoA hydrolase
MQLEERLRNSETHQSRMVFPGSLNDNGILFGGTALQWMDEVAYITAQRFTRMKMLTVSVENVKFRKAAIAGSIVKIIGKVNKVGRVKIDIQVEMFIENLEDNTRELAVDAIFTFAAINDKMKPICFDLTTLQ